MSVKSVKSDAAAGSGLRFFSQMSASISHEIKNVLAIINENAGLLDDFTLMAERGVPLDPPRLKKMAATIMTQVNRGDRMVKNMNRLAHSIDETIASVDVGEFLELFVALTARLAAGRNMTIEPQLPQNELRITTSPFYLLNFLWACLVFALDAGGGVERIVLNAERTAGGCTIRFKGLAGFHDVPTENFPSEGDKSLLDLLEVDLTTDPRDGEILLKLPATIKENL